MSLDKLKLSKQLVTAMTDAGYISAKEIQAKTMSRIIGGQDLIAVAPEGAGKTTNYVLGVLMRLKYGDDEAPKVLILVPDKERALAVIEEFLLLSKNRNLRIIGLYGTGGMETEVNDLSDGVDIVVALPTRARAVYLKLGLNLSKLQMFIVDDAEQIVKQGMQLPVCELARSAGKCQHLVFTTVVHEKLNNMIDQFMNFPTTLEVDELGERKAETHDLMLYQVPNFKTKINLLNLLLRDDEVFDQVVVFVNTRLTAQKLGKALFSRHANEVSVLNPLFFDEEGFDHIEDFKDTPEARILIVANEGTSNIDLSGIPFLFHFEIPENKETFLSRIVKTGAEEVAAISFATDMELVDVRKIEQSIGVKIPVMDLPEDLVIDKAAKSAGNKVKTVKESADNPKGGGAFHDKKESNTKDYNYGIGQKAKMTMKKKHG
ncbi:DEAD/DEAH box helicase [Pedobacter metabolipauper]|uniref:ATP-dependent RNA helicase RhlE n=1 Tax=Pedobacter metabolipauper TaxID=425513 RepID=A0A4R6SRB6_9SPHI|nr:DEAD/DEAH box helicase [Pedobacter metabolipauper]TDQ06897.1 ATP-dependent RNA helicase RhlE [Pedobacter metabolipauper]